MQLHRCGISTAVFLFSKMPLYGWCVGSFSEDRPLGWDPVAAGNRAGDGMARFVSEEKATDVPAFLQISIDLCNII